MVEKSHSPDWYNIALKVLVHNKEGQTLILKIPEQSDHAGYYDLPGGRINEDEFASDYEALLQRELDEEIGIDIKIAVNLDPVSFSRGSYFSRRRQKQIRVFYLLFKGEHESGEPIISDEHAGYEWVDLSTIALEDYFIDGMLEAVKRYCALRR
ncbi:hypothetical protein BK004_03480 [bacterium CG10_46_32]|nr:MAG: hypothetical protein BK004_03480 [bacterium CG10_46_32]PIR55942.1 MAG: hypothetical protein COU73_03510 [Parcubacteria group bacterium CG10_big_fil_rev_8_21_14_0_10_46_32]